MLGDTITITHNAIARALSKINQDNYSSEYMLRTATEEFRLAVRHSLESVAKTSALPPFERHNLELRVTTFATATTPETTNIFSVVIRSRRGTDPAATLLTAKAAVAWFTDPNISKLIAWES